MHLARHIALLTEVLMVITAEHLQPLSKQVLVEHVLILLVTMEDLLLTHLARRQGTSLPKRVIVERLKYLSKVTLVEVVQH